MGAIRFIRAHLDALTALLLGLVLIALIYIALNFGGLLIYAWRKGVLRWI